MECENLTMAPTEVVRCGREPALDGVRGIAVLIVVFLHLHILRGGHLGVDIFFVLSGFLITSLLLNEIDRTGSFSATLFYSKRCIRLLPPLMITLILAIIMAWFEGSAATSYADVFASATYTSNYWHGGDRYLWHTWSLSLEAQFYLIWPFFVLTISRRDPRSIYKILSAILVLVFLWRLYVLHGIDEDWGISRTYSGLDTRCDTLVAGSFVAFAFRDGAVINHRTTAYFLMACVAAVTLTIRPGNFWMHSIGFSLIAISLAYILGYIVSNRKSVISKCLALRPFVYFGNISYGLYLYHFPIMQFLEKDFRSPLIVGAAVSILAASASWHFLEKPLLGRRPARFSAVVEPTR